MGDTDIRSTTYWLQRIWGKITGVIAVSVAPASGFIHGQKTVATAGIHGVLGAGNLKAGLHVKALPGNDDVIYIGLDGVTSATGYPLEPGEEIYIEVDRVEMVYMSPAANGDGAAWIGS